MATPRDPRINPQRGDRLLVEYGSRAFETLVLAVAGGYVYCRTRTAGKVHEVKLKWWQFVHARAKVVRVAQTPKPRELPPESRPESIRVPAPQGIILDRLGKMSSSDILAQLAQLETTERLRKERRT